MRRVPLGPPPIEEGAVKAYEVEGTYLLASRWEGRLHAIRDTCNHAGCLLSRGKVSGREVTCPCHGVVFDLVTGRNLNAPHLCGDQDVVPVELEGDRLVAQLED